MTELELALNKIKELETEIEELQGTVEFLSNQVDDADKRADEAQENAPNAANIIACTDELLDYVERSVGTLHCTIPPSPSSSRAILALFDAVDRRL